MGREITVGEHTYLIADLQTRENWGLYCSVGEQISGMDIRNIEAIEKLLAMVVTEWDWEGDPSDIAAWALIPNGQKNKLAGEIAGQLKN